MRPQEKEAIARELHRFVTDIHRRGGGEKEIVRSPDMASHVQTFGRLLDMASWEELDALEARYEGFEVFSRIVEAVALALRHGVIPDSPWRVDDVLWQ